MLILQPTVPPASPSSRILQQCHAASASNQFLQHHMQSQAERRIHQVVASIVAVHGIDVRLRVRSGMLTD